MNFFRGEKIFAFGFSLVGFLVLFNLVINVSFGQVGSISSESDVIESVPGGKCEDPKTGKKLSKEETVDRCKESAKSEASKSCDAKEKAENAQGAKVCKCPAGAKLVKCELEKSFSLDGEVEVEPLNLSDLSCGEINEGARAGQTKADLTEAETKLREAQEKAGNIKADLEKAEAADKKAKENAKAKKAESNKANDKKKRAADAIANAVKAKTALNNALSSGSLRPGATADLRQANIDKALNEATEAAKSAQEDAERADHESFEAELEVIRTEAKVKGLKALDAEIKALEKQIADLKKKLDRDPTSAGKALVCTAKGKCSLKWNIECVLETGGEEIRKSVRAPKEPSKSVFSEGVKNFSIIDSDGRKFIFTPPSRQNASFNIFSGPFVIDVQEIVTVETSPMTGLRVVDRTPPIVPVTTAPPSSARVVGGQTIESDSKSTDSRGGSIQSGAGRPLFSPFGGFRF